MATLRLITDSGRQFELRGGDASLGRDPGCDVPLDDRSVSRTHAVLSLRDGVWRIRDQASANGLVLDDRRVIEAELRHGQTLLLGNVRLQVRLVDDDDDSQGTLLIDRSALQSPGIRPVPAPVPRRDLRWLWLVAGAGLAGLFVIAAVGGLLLMQRFGRVQPDVEAETAAAETSATPGEAEPSAEPPVANPGDGVAEAPAAPFEAPGTLAPAPASAPAPAPMEETRVETAPGPPPTLAAARVTLPPVAVPRPPSTRSAPVPEPTPVPAAEWVGPPPIPPAEVADAVRSAALEVDAENYLAAANRLLQLAARLDGAGDPREAARLRVYAGVALVGQGQLDGAQELFAEALRVLGRRVKVVSDDFSPQSREVLILAAELLNATPMPGVAPE